MIFRRLPEWTKKVFYPGSEFENMMLEFFALDTRTPEMIRLKFGFLLQEILNRFMSKVQSTLQPDRVLWFYSGHDLTISNILNIFGLYVSFGHHCQIQSDGILFCISDRSTANSVRINV